MRYPILFTTAISVLGLNLERAHSGEYFYSSKAIYKAEQNSARYEAAPDGFEPFYTQLVQRHGARGLSSPKYDILTKQVWNLAQERGQLTPLGQKLGPITDQVIAANNTLGYGLLTQIGEEETAGIAHRMAQRLSPLLTQSGIQSPICIQVQTSGKERANQTAHYFMTALANNVDFVNDDPAKCYQNQPNPNQIDSQLINKFELYSHKTDPQKSTKYQAYSDNYQAYKAFQESDKLNDVLDQLDQLPQTKAIARQMLERLYTKEYVDFLEHQVSKNKQCDVKADNCFKTKTRMPGETEDDWKYVQHEVDAALMLYNMFIIGPGMLREAQQQGNIWNLEQFITPEESAWFSYLSDAEDFYEKGPSFSDNNGVTFNIAKPLLADMFSEMKRALDNEGQPKMLAKLRFAHAEQIMPLAALLKVNGSQQPAHPDELYSQENNPWRGDWVTPYSANIQWDLYRNPISGQALVKMLYNEKETLFKSDCQPVPGTQFYYSLTELEQCYSEELTLP